MSNILLIDIDSKIPNLALMQISAHHKAQGDNVGFNISDPDKVYASCVFTKNKHHVDGLKFFYPNADIFIGGSGINYNWLPDNIQKIKPDYDLYPSEYSQGFTTRGCIRNCPFCIVRDKEGKYQRWQHISEFHNPKFNKVYLMDNNIYADKEWFFDNTQFLIDHNLQVNISQGMDVRILDEEIAQRLAELKFYKPITFAFDNMKDEKAVREGIKLLQKVGIDIKRNLQFFVLTGYNTTFEEDVYRAQMLKDCGTNAFVMQYKKTKQTRTLARWANRRWAYWACDFKDYDRKRFG